MTGQFVIAFVEDGHTFVTGPFEQRHDAEIAARALSELHAEVVRMNDWATERAGLGLEAVAR